MSKQLISCSINAINDETNLPEQSLSPPITSSSKNLIENVFDEKVIQKENIIEDDSYLNFTIEEVTLVSFIKFTNPSSFLDKKKEYKLKPLRLYYQKYQREIYIIIKLIPEEELQSIRIFIKFYLSKEELECEENSGFKQNTDNLQTDNSSNTEFSLFINNSIQKKFNEKEVIVNSTNFEEFPIDICLNVYHMEKECYIKTKREKMVISNVKFIYNNDDYLRIEELLYDRLFDPLILRIKFTCQSKIPQKCDDFVGLQNEGNTCYMNSIIQTLFHLPIINKIIFEQVFDENSIIYKFQKLFYQLKTEKTPIKFTNIFYSLGFDKAFWNSQQDAQEIFLFIFETLNSALKEKMNNMTSSLVDLFEGKLENTVFCVEKNFVSKITETFLFLQIDLERDSLLENIENLLKVEQLIEDNQYQLEDGSKHDAIKSSSFSKLPPILLVQLKRFRYKENSMIKIHKKIEFDQMLDLKNYYSKKDVDSTPNHNVAQYEIYAIIVHEGEIDLGHYYVIIKNFNNKIKHPYIKFNDSRVTYATEQEVYHDYCSEKIIEIDKSGKMIKSEKQFERTPYIIIYTETSKRDDIFINYPLDKIPSDIFRALNKRERNTICVPNQTSYYSENRNINSNQSNNSLLFNRAIFNKNIKNSKSYVSPQTIVDSTKFNSRIEISSNKKKINSNGVEKNIKDKIIDLRISDFVERKNMLRRFQVKTYKNKSKDFKLIEYSTTCDKKITSIDFLQVVMNIYNKSKEDYEKDDLSYAKLYIKAKNEIFEKFLEDKEEIQDILYEVSRNKSKHFCVVIMNEDFLEFDDFLKMRDSKRYVNINFCGFIDPINPCFTDLEIDDFSKLEIKQLMKKLKEFTSKNFSIDIDESRTFFIDVNEDISKNLFDIKTHKINDHYYLRLLQTQYIRNLIKIYIKE